MSEHIIRIYVCMYFIIILHTVFEGLASCWSPRQVATQEHAEDSVVQGLAYPKVCRSS